FSSRRRHTRFSRDWSSDVCSSDLKPEDNPFSTHYQGKYKKKKEENNMTATWEIVDAVLNHSPRILLMGPPGTGKTYAGTRLGLRSEERRVGKEARQRCARSRDGTK